MTPSNQSYSLRRSGLFFETKLQVKKVWCYTVNHPETLTELLEIGVDGIFTDRPDWAKQFIMDRGSISQTSP